MAEISAKMVKDLREATGAGMMDCKKALSDPEVNGDFDKAVEFLRKKGLAAAAKKASRVAAEGVVKYAISEDAKKAVLVEVNSETDFVAKNEKFNTYVDEVAAQALSFGSSDVEAFLKEKWALDPLLTVEEKLSSMVATIGEKLTIRRIELVEGDVVVPYIHGEGKIGVLVAGKVSAVSDAVKDALKNIAMQIAALNAKYLDMSEVSEEFKAHELEVIKANIAQDPKFAGKPEKVLEGAASGRLNKELKEFCLLEQDYVKSADDSDKTVAKYVAKVAKETGSDFAVKSFIRLERGEGIEKKVDDFAAEVAAQAGM